MPQVHGGSVVRHYQRPGKPYLAIKEQDLPAGERICVPVPKGGALLLTNRTPHASFENRTNTVRWSMDLRYQNTSLPTNAPITRLEEETDPPEDVPIACYPPEADFLVRSRRRPGQVLSDPAEFHRLRSEHISRPVTPRWPQERA